MAEVPTGASHREELVNVVRQVRHRWRMKLLVRGAIVIVAGALAALALASYGLQVTKFSPTWVTGLRIVTWTVFVGLLAMWLLRPLRRRATDEQVALYIEEYEPSLQAAILGAVHVGALGGGSAPADVPPVIVDRMIEQAAEKARAIEGGRSVGRSHLKRYAIALGTVAGLALLVMMFGPEFLRQGASALLDIRRTAEAASPYAITVQPGDATIPRGSDQTVTARLAGFRSNEVALFVKPEGAPKFDRVPLVATADPMTFEGMLFHVGKPIDYYVEADGVRSLDYKMKIVELPAVAKLELEYIFPAYTGLPSQKVESGGDVAALRGTEVRVKITPTMASPAGQLQLDPGTPSGLTAQPDGTLTGSFKMDKDGFYQVELDGPHGERVTASPKYTVDVIEDQAPTVTFEKPKRDTSANPIEEVFVQAHADDDFGVKQLDLIYSVNGGDEKTVSLYGKGAKPLQQVSAGHTIYLEELGVKPGDFVSYYAKAYDTDTVQGPKSTSSDIYFVKILPYNQNVRQAQSQGGGGGGGGQQNQAGALSEQERQIISATFNVERDRPKTAADKFKENTVFIGLSQSKLREQVQELVQQMQQRLGNDESFRKIAEILPKAADEMKNAEDQLKGLKTKDALAPEQRALKHLQDAEQLYDLILRQGGGGGGGGGGGQMASELADLFQLELDRRANQYETAQRADQQNTNQQIDDLAERLRELARRQLAQAEQQRQRGQQQQGGGGGGSSQRQLADEAEQAARQLEQLRHQLEQQGQSRQDLADASRRLQDAANAMRQAAANNQNGGASADQALQQLQEAQRLLQQSSTQRVGDAVKDAQRKAEALAQEQKNVAQQVAGLDSAGASKDTKLQQLKQEKTDMKNQVGDLEQQLSMLGRQTLNNNQRDASRKLQEAASSIREQMLKEKIEYSKEAMSSGPEYAKPIENEIGSNLDSLKQKIGEASAAVDKADQGQGLSRALDQTTNLLRGTQTLNETLNQRLGQQQGQQGQPGQQGDQQSQQQGQQGQQGQGQQGQQGQGQQGQQSQSQQGQQGQGQQGQQGQQGPQGQGGQGQGQQGRQGDRQGQQGQQGQPRLGGQTRGGDPNGPFTGNPSSPGAMSGDARPGLSNGEARDVRNEARQLANDAQALRQRLQQSGATGKDLQSVDDVIKLLRGMDNDKATNDPRGLQELAATALEKLTKFEWDLRKRVDTSNDALYLSGTEDAPTAYKDMIEQYYRALSKKAGGKSGGGK